MKSITFLTILVITILTVQLYGQEEIRSTGVGFRISYYNGSGHSTTFEHVGYSLVASKTRGGGGVTFFVLSRFADRFSVELSVGGLAHVDVEQKWYWDEEVEVFSAVPLLTGIRFDLLPIHSPSMIKPYLSVGSGAYILSDIHVIRESGVERGTIETHLTPGAYGAAGLNLNLSSRLALNFETKYHWVDFNFGHDRSNVEIGLGLVYSWGAYTPSNRKVSYNIKD